MTSKIEYTDEDMDWMVFTPPRESVTDYSKYSDIQARDYRGRWTTGGALAGWEKAEPTAEGRQHAYDTKHASVLAERPNDMVLANTMAEAAAKKYDKYYETYDIYRKGDITLEVDKRLPDAEALTKEYATYVSEISAAHPLNTQTKVVITSEDLLESGGTTNAYTAGNGIIAISVPNVAKNFQVNGENWHMPAETKENAKEYVLAHEWGHATDYSFNFVPSQKTYAAVVGSNSWDSLSEYGQSKSPEMYGEMFAQSYMESKYPGVKTSPLTPLLVTGANL